VLDPCVGAEPKMMRSKPNASRAGPTANGDNRWMYKVVRFVVRLVVRFCSPQQRGQHVRYILILRFHSFASFVPWAGTGAPHDGGRKARKRFEKRESEAACDWYWR
jgi:hypothetical protein